MVKLKSMDRETVPEMQLSIEATVWELVLSPASQGGRCTVQIPKSRKWVLASINFLGAASAIRQKSSRLARPDSLVKYL